MWTTVGRWERTAPQMATAALGSGFLGLVFLTNSNLQHLYSDNTGGDGSAWRVTVTLRCQPSLEVAGGSCQAFSLWFPRIEGIAKHFVTTCPGWKCQRGGQLASGQLMRWEDSSSVETHNLMTSGGEILILHDLQELHGSGIAEAPLGMRRWKAA